MSEDFDRTQTLKWFEGLDNKQLSIVWQFAEEMIRHEKEMDKIDLALRKLDAKEKQHGKA